MFIHAHAAVQLYIDICAYLAAGASSAQCAMLVHGVSITMMQNEQKKQSATTR